MHFLGFWKIMLLGYIRNVSYIYHFILIPFFDLYFIRISGAVSLSFGFLLCKGMAVKSDTKHQAMPYSAKTFLEAFRKCCSFGYS